MFLKALDHSLRDISGVLSSIAKNQVFAGKTIVFGANYALSKIPHGSHEDTVNAFLQRSTL